MCNEILRDLNAVLPKLSFHQLFFARIFQGSFAPGTHFGKHSQGWHEKGLENETG